MDLQRDRTAKIQERGVTLGSQFADAGNGVGPAKMYVLKWSATWDDEFWILQYTLHSL